MSKTYNSQKHVNLDKHDSSLGNKNAAFIKGNYNLMVFSVQNIN